MTRGHPPLIVNVPWRRSLSSRTPGSKSVWAPPISVPEKKEGTDGGYLGLSQVRHRPVVQHTSQNPGTSSGLGVRTPSAHRSASHKMISKASVEGCPLHSTDLQPVSNHRDSRFRSCALRSPKAIFFTAPGPRVSIRYPFYRVCVEPRRGD
jgi:hypothetical protein